MKGRKEESNKTKKRRDSVKNNSLDSLIHSLVQQESTKDGKANFPTTKEERIQKRLAKKRKREDKQQQREIHSLPTTHKQGISHQSGTDTYSVSKKLRTTSSSKQKLLDMADYIENLVQQVAAQCDYRRKPYKPLHARSTKHRKLNWNEDGIQPRKRDYGGIGLARPSLFLPNNDPAFLPRLEEEFKEHIPGFFGKKQRAKAAKKQNKMLWQTMKDVKQLKGVNLEKLSPDERVERLIEAGLI